MTTFSVRLRRFNSVSASWETAYEFEANPFVSPEITCEYDDFEPPRVVLANWAWTIQGKLYGDDSSMAEEVSALTSAIVNKSAVNGVQLLRDGSVVEEISAEGGFYQVRVETLTSPLVDGQWQTAMPFTLKISGVEYVNTVPGVLTLLSQTLSYEYDETGLLTKTLSGELRVAVGSAEAAARTLGLALPGLDFAYVTRGPEGVNVEVLDQADHNARFTSIVRQAGAALPPGVSAGFEVEVETTNVDGVDITTTTVTAEGPDALAAVKSKRPAGRLTETIRSGTFQRRASAIYVTKKPSANATPLKRRTFVTTGGTRPTRWFKRTGGRKPRPHFGLFSEVVIDEVVTLERTGSPELLLNNPIMPPSLDDGHTISEDMAGTRLEGGPDLIEKGKDASGDVWQVRFARRYTATDLHVAFIAVAKASIGQDHSSSLDVEVQKRTPGKD